MMNAGQVHADIEAVLFSAADLQSRTGELGAQIARDYADKRPLLVAVLKGSFLFLADLARAIHPVPAGLQVHFVRASSYGGGTSSSGKVQLKLEGLTPEQVAGQHILLVEDIIDTGHTITTLTAHMEALGAASVATATLLNKLERRVVPFTPQYQGFRCPDQFVVGYGLDFDEEYRSLPYVGVLKEECYAAKLGLLENPISASN